MTIFILMAAIDARRGRRAQYWEFGFALSDRDLEHAVEEETPV
jgi:hypothetical protein